MQKTILQFVVLIALFISVFWGLKSINWIKKFKIEEAKNSTEEKLGKLYWESIKTQYQEVKQSKIKLPIEKLLNTIYIANHIDTNRITLHVVNNPEINAFALPGKIIVVNTGLLNNCKSETELAGVLAHEIAHIQKNHIMQNLVKEFGLSLLISITTNGNNETIQQTLKTITSTAYDRSLETEADFSAADYLIKAKINPEGFANFLYRLSKEEENIPQQAFWISTHPQSKERAEAIIFQIENVKEKTYKAVLTSADWQQMQTTINELD